MKKGDPGITVMQSELEAAQQRIQALEDQLTQQQDEIQKLRKESRIDDLTQLKNRRGWNEDAGLLFKIAARHAQPITCACLDVDNLKTVNDSQGHMVGDSVLKAVGKTLSDSIRSTDVVARLGGDEFSFVLLSMNASDARVLVSRLHQQLLKAMRDRGWATGVSMGVVSFSDSIPTMQDAMAYADYLMYKAKNNCRGTMIFKEYAG